MATAKSSSFLNPHFEVIVQDIRDRSKWSEIDGQIIKRRLGERKKRKLKPYKGAPNGVVPIVDDVTREKTNQEMAMHEQAQRYAHFIPLDARTPPEVVTQASAAFDTFLRHLEIIAPKREECIDTKNARGMGVMEITRKKHPRYGELPTCESMDPRLLIVPAATARLQDADRMCKIAFYSPGEFRREADRHQGKWKHVDQIIDECSSEDREVEGEDQAVVDALELTKGLIGIDTASKDSPVIVIYDFWHYADQWSVDQDLSGRVKLGMKCHVIFCPKLPDVVVNAAPWKKPDAPGDPLSTRELAAEVQAAINERRAPSRFAVAIGEDKPWPYVQSRQENRSKYYHNTRGSGHLCMDDQIFATGMLNAKMTIIDYTQLPMYTGTATRMPTNITHQPGSYIPGDVHPIEMGRVPETFDFGVEQFKRASARRMGALSQYEFSGELTSNKKVQKTATEVSTETARGTMVSSADVDRFNQPWHELYQQLWDELTLMRTALPMIENLQFKGMTTDSIYDWPMLVVPAGSAKTLDPDMQFRRNTAAWQWLSGMIELGLNVDVHQVAMDVMSYWDPFAAQRWIIPPDQEGPQGQVPVYRQLEAIMQQLQQQGEGVEALTEAIEQVGKLATQNSEELDQREEQLKQAGGNRGANRLALAATSGR